jgi:hypothetical protein
VLPTSSGSKNKPSKKQAQRSCLPSNTPAGSSYLLYAGFLLGLFFDTEKGGNLFL